MTKTKTNNSIKNTIKANNSLRYYASKGLRTLVFGSRVIPAREYKQWSEDYELIKDLGKS